MQHTNDHEFTVVAFAEQDVSPSIEQGTYAGHDLAEGIMDLCSQFRERFGAWFTRKEMDEIVAEAMQIATDGQPTQGGVRIDVT